MGLPGGWGSGRGRGLRGGPEPQTHTLQLDTSGHATGVGVSTGGPFSAWQWYNVQLSTRLLTQVSLG